MRDDIRLFQEEGIDGIIIGIRAVPGGLETEAMHAVLGETGGLRTTLNHVFDGSLPALEQAKAFGVDRVSWDGLRWDDRRRRPDDVEKPGLSGEILNIWGDSPPCRWSDRRAYEGLGDAPEYRLSEG